MYRGRVGHMAGRLNGTWIVGYTTASQRNNGWVLSGEDEDVDGHFDILVLAIPSGQAVTLLAQHDFGMAREAMLARFQPCWTAIFAFDAPLPTDASHLRDGDVIGWASRETNKPGRTGLERWVVQASASWSADCLEEPADEVAEALLTALAKELRLPPLQPIAQSTHRWRFAMSTGLGTGSLWNSHICLGVCGDWLLGPRIECGWLSGRHLSGKILVEELVAVAD